MFKGSWNQGLWQRDEVSSLPVSSAVAAAAVDLTGWILKHWELLWAAGERHLSLCKAARGELMMETGWRVSQGIHPPLGSVCVPGLD